MKKALSLAGLLAPLAALAATFLAPPGLTPAPAFRHGAILTAAALVSTNASATATVKAIYTLSGGRAVTNDLVSLAAQGGFAETNGLRRCILPSAALLVTGGPVTLYTQGF